MKTCNAAAAAGVLFAVVAFTGCGSSTAPAEASTTPAAPAFDEPGLPVPADALLAHGQVVYRENCATCHNRGKKGAPRFGDHEAWAPRLVQGMDTLLEHAVTGFVGPTGSEMPARGGNDDLGDTDVRAAATYLTAPVR